MPIYLSQCPSMKCKPVVFRAAAFERSRKQHTVHFPPLGFHYRSRSGTPPFSGYLSLPARKGAADPRCLSVVVVGRDGKKFGTQPQFFFCASFSFAPFGCGQLAKFSFAAKAGPQFFCVDTNLSGRKLAAVLSSPYEQSGPKARVRSAFL